MSQPRDMRLDEVAFCRANHIVVESTSDCFQVVVVELGKLSEWCYFVPQKETLTTSEFGVAVHTQSALNRLGIVRALCLRRLSEIEVGNK